MHCVAASIGILDVGNNNRGDCSYICFVWYQLMKPVMVLAQQGVPAPRCVPSLVVRMGRSQITLCMYLPWLCRMHDMVHC